jgi:hypothetical protein
MGNCHKERKNKRNEVRQKQKTTAEAEQSLSTILDMEVSDGEH